MCHRSSELRESATPFERLHSSRSATQSDESACPFRAVSNQQRPAGPKRKADSVDSAALAWCAWVGEGLELAPTARVTSTASTYSATRLSMRRIVGIVTGICALYLMVGAVAAPCNDHSARAGSEVMNAATHGHDGARELPATKNNQPAPCKSASVPCCVAMISCATVAIAVNRASPLPPIASQGVSSLEFGKPLSRIAAPEPPPPKA
jgi:hypothetical protein